MSRRRRLTDEQALSAPDLLLSGMTWQEIADAFSVSRNTIQNLFSGKNYHDLQDRIQPKLAAARAAGRGRNDRAYRRNGKRRCTKCASLLPENADHFPIFTRRGESEPIFEARCRECKKKQNQTRYIKSKLRVLRHYSGGEPRCECCGETVYEFLTVDHINGGGGKHRADIKKGKGGVSSIHLWLEAQSCPDGYRVLCLNCNASIGWFGYCPHQGRPDGLLADLIAE